MEPTWYRLTITDSEGAMSAVELYCTPPSGTHPDPDAACSELVTASGDPANLRPDPAMLCPMYYDPVTATARGHWYGHPIAFEATYGNSCELTATTGALFAIQDI